MLRGSVLLAVCLVALQVVQIGGQYYSRCEPNANTKRKLVNLIDPNVMSCPPLGDDDDRYCCLYGNNYRCCDAREYLEQTTIGFVLPLAVSMLVAMMIICCVCCMCCPCCFWYKRRNRGAVYNTVTQQQQQQAEAPPVPQHGPQSSVYQQQQYAYAPQQHGYYPPPYPMMQQQNYPMMNPQDAYPPAVPPHAAPYPPAVPPHAQLTTGPARDHNWFPFNPEVEAQPMPPPYSEAKSSNPMYGQQAPYNPNF